jgi:hypothetical protein
MLARQPEQGALLCLRVVLDEGVVRNPNPLDHQTQPVIRHELYDRRAKAACERMLF